jgi:hypothetical protein
MQIHTSVKAVVVALMLIAPTAGSSENVADGPDRQKPASAPAPATVAVPQASTQIRVYEGFGTLGPIYDQRGVPPYAVDVGVGLTACPDGNTEITSLNIGGWLYQLGSICQDSGPGAQPGSISVRTVSAGEPAVQPPRQTVTQTKPAEPGDTVIRCNPQTWDCSR